MKGFALSAVSSRARSSAETTTAMGAETSKGGGAHGEIEEDRVGGEVDGRERVQEDGDIIPVQAHLEAVVHVQHLVKVPGANQFPRKAKIATKSDIFVW